MNYRPVEFEKSDRTNGSYHKSHKENFGWFHKWVEKDKSILALVEDAEGRIHFVDPSELRFTDRFPIPQ